MDNSLLAVRDISHKYIVVERKKIKMYYAITETKVYTAKSLSLLNRSMNGLMDEDEFKQICCGQAFL